MQHLENVVPPLVAVLAESLAAQASVAAGARDLADGGDVMAALGALQGLEARLPDALAMLAALGASRRAVEELSNTGED